MQAIHQELLEAINPAGVRVQFVVLDDQRCAVIHGGAWVYVGSGDEEGIGGGLELFSRLSHSHLSIRREPVLQAG